MGLGGAEAPHPSPLHRGEPIPLRKSGTQRARGRSSSLSSCPGAWWMRDHRVTVAPGDSSKRPRRLTKQASLVRPTAPPAISGLAVATRGWTLSSRGDTMMWKERKYGQSRGQAKHKFKRQEAGKRSPIFNPLPSLQMPWDSIQGKWELSLKVQTKHMTLGLGPLVQPPCKSSPKQLPCGRRCPPPNMCIHTTRLV